MFIEDVILSKFIDIWVPGLKLVPVVVILPLVVEAAVATLSTDYAAFTFFYDSFLKKVFIGPKSLVVWNSLNDYSRFFVSSNLFWEAV